MALKFFEDFNKLYAKEHPEAPAAAATAEEIAGLTVDDMKKQFDTLKKEIISEIKNKTVDTVDNSVDNSGKIDNNEVETVDITKEGGNTNAS